MTTYSIQDLLRKRRKSQGTENPQADISDLLDGLSPDQRAVVETAVDPDGPQYLAVIGHPGTGKTFTTEKIIQAIKHRFRGEPMVCAPTGKAALLVGGVTIHSGFGLVWWVVLCSCKPDQAFG